MTDPTTLPNQADEEHENLVDQIRHLHYLKRAEDDVIAIANYILANFIPKAQATALQEQFIGIIYSLANDLANNDPKAIGSVSTAPYMANALAIYSEYLKGDNFERIDWRELKLPTLERLIAQSKEGGPHE